MNLIQRAIGALIPSTAKIQLRSTPLDNPAIPLNSWAAYSWLSSTENASEAGEFVNPDTAMRIAAYYSATKVLAESIGSLTFNLFKRTDSGRVIAYNHPLYRLIAKQPNEDMTSQTFWEALVTSVSLFGNFYAAIDRDANGVPTALWPLLAAQTDVVRLDDGSIAYRTMTTVKDGKENQIILPGKNVFHVMLNSLDGLRGLNPIQMAREMLGRARALDKFSSRWFKNYATPQLALINKSPLPMSPEDVTKAKEDFERLYGNNGNSHRIAVLDADFELKQLSLDAESAQYLETHQFSRSEICGLLRVPEHFIGSLDRITNSNLETMNRQFATQTLRPWLTRIEAELERKCLFPQEGQSVYFIEADISDFVRGDSTAITAALTAGINSGWLTPNECRLELGLNPGPDYLDTFRTPVNYMNAQILVSQLDQPAEGIDETGVNDDSSVGDVSISNIRAAYTPLFTQAVRNVLAGGNNFVATFGPLIESLMEMRSVSLDTDSAQLVTDVLSRIEKRAKTWAAGNEAAIAVDEMKSAVRAIVFGLKELEAKKELAAL